MIYMTFATKTFDKHISDFSFCGSDYNSFNTYYILSQ